LLLVLFALHAHAIATTRHDGYKRLLAIFRSVLQR
jgi:hypothetical protein